MPSKLLPRLLLIGLAALLLPPRPNAALPRQGLAPEPPALAGHLLIASPGIGDPRFAHTVLLMIRHDKTGALGVTINRPVGETSLAALLDALGDTGTTGTATVRVFAGGPVQPAVGFVIHTTDYEQPQTVRINADLAVTTNPDVLREMARNKGPRKALVALGYAGWSPGQLEAELARDDWLVAPADAALVFDTPREQVWEEAMARRSVPDPPGLTP